MCSECSPNARCTQERGETQKTCKCNRGYYGNGFQCDKVCVCRASGDPHYYTYDKQRVDFMGPCKYTLTRYTSSSDSNCSFAVEVKNIDKYKFYKKGRNGVTYTNAVDLKFRGHVYRIGQRNVVTVDGKKVSFPQEGKHLDVQISLSGRYIVLSTACGVQVLYDGRTSATVIVPQNYASQATGLCGNCNGQHDDFTHPDIKVAGRKRGTKLLIPLSLGHLYQVVDDGLPRDDRCGAAMSDVPEPKTCSAAAEKQVNHYCSSVLDKNGPFKVCYQLADQIDFQTVYENCYMDVCAAAEASIVVNACEILAALAEQCEELGVRVSWRSQHFCPIQCGANEVYQTNAEGCEPSCDQPNGPVDCKMPNRDGCFPKTGYVRYMTQAIRKSECGCVSEEDGLRYKLGSKWIAKDCSMTYECIMDDGQYEILATPKGCARNSHCGIENNVRQCVCDFKYEPDGKGGCKAIEKYDPETTISVGGRLVLTDGMQRDAMVSQDVSNVADLKPLSVVKELEVVDKRSVVVYSQPDYQGGATVLQQGRYEDLKASGISSVGSVRFGRLPNECLPSCHKDAACVEGICKCNQGLVGDGVKSCAVPDTPALPPASDVLILFRNTNFQGEQFPLDAASTFFSKFNDKAQSAIVKGTMAWRLYQHAHYQGRYIDLKPGKYTSLPNNFNRIASSAKPYVPVPPDTQDGLTLYEGKDYQGKSVPLSAATTFLSGFNDKAQSAVITGTMSWRIYQHSNYQGRYITLNPGSYASLPENFNRIASSAKPDKVVQDKLVLYDQDNCRGKKVVIYANIPDLTVKNFNNVAKSLSIGGEKKWDLYDAKNYRRFLNTVGSTACISATKIGGNDRLTSVRVHGSVTAEEPNEVELYATLECTGEPFVIKQDSPDLSVLNFDKKTQCVIVRGKKSWQLYSEPNYLRQVSLLPPGEHSKDKLGGEVSSLREEKDPTVVECEDHLPSAECESMKAAGKCTTSDMFLKCRKTCSTDNCGSCINGYNYDEVTRACTDINECTDQGGNPCVGDSTCHNLPGSYVCKCRPEHKYDENKGCVVKDPSEYYEIPCVNILNNCEAKKAEAGFCTQRYAQIYCRAACQLCNQCPSGYVMETGTTVCQDVDECKTEAHKCVEHAHCANVYGGYECKCGEGYQGDGKVKCEEIKATTTAAPAQEVTVAGPPPLGPRPDLLMQPMNDVPLVPPETQPPEPPQDDDTEEDKYFQPPPVDPYVVRPKPLGVASGVIPDKNLAASSSLPSNEPVKARPLSGSAWEPLGTDTNPYLEVDIGTQATLHGIGTLGSPDKTKECWVTEYEVKISPDGQTWVALEDRNNTAQARAFEGNNDRNTWKRHCLHRYYGSPKMARYVRFYPLKNSGCTAMRVELYGIRAFNDPVMLDALQKDPWTRNTTGCRCYFDHYDTDCACCMPGGCQCSSSNKHQCVQCGSPNDCGSVDKLVEPQEPEDAWTASPSGCPCYPETTGTACACCKNYGIQCLQNKNQCHAPGHPEDCGQNEEKFGPNPYCTPKTCP